MKNEITALRLKEALSDLDMKPQELADRSGVSKASISQYLSGSHAPSNISSGKMGKILRVEPMWLMGFDVSKKKGPTPDMAKEDFKLLEKFSLLDNRDKETILSMIDVMLSRKEKSEDWPHFSKKSFMNVCRYPKVPASSIFSIICIISFL